MLCPADTSSLVTKSKSKKPPADFDMLSAMKPTEGLRWAHVLCSVYTPEVVYTHPNQLKAVEGIMSVDEARWQEVSDPSACIWTMLTPGLLTVQSSRWISDSLFRV